MIANFDSMYSCKTSYNVQSHSHWGLGQFVRGGEGWSSSKFLGRGSDKKESLPILDLQRLASLLMGLNPLACEQALRLGKG